MVTTRLAELALNPPSIAEEPEQRPADGCLYIEGEMTLPRAAELKQILLDALEQQASLVVDVSRVSEIDTAGIQLLLFAKQAAHRKHKELCLVELSPAVRAVVELLNLSTYFSETHVVQAPCKKSP